MKISEAARAANERALLDAAGRQLRTHGVAAMSVAEVSRAAGLTHGALYGHFGSKQALAEAACRSVCDRSVARWRRRAGQAREDGRDPVHAIVDGYLTPAHRDAPEDGCLLPSAGPDLVRAEPALRGVVADGVAALVDTLAAEIAARDGLPAGAEGARAAAHAAFATMTGGLLLARALADRPADSDAALAAAASAARAAADRNRKD
jgi:TetR/AcrR family transcriptional regulator, transcriptional repressor for nem operon